MDIEKFYDSIRLCLIAGWLLSNGCAVALVGAVSRHQLLPSLNMQMGNVSFVLQGRSKATLTGSRLAGTCGRIPVEATVLKLFPQLAPLGFPVASGSLTIATFVDNLFAFSISSADAVRQLDLIAEELSETWSLKIKAGSRQWMACRGSTSAPWSTHSWEEMIDFLALGHVISYDGGSYAFLERTRKLVWKSFFSNAGHKRFVSAPLSQKLVLINRATRPVWQYCCTRWPPSKGVLKYESRLQTKMVASVQRLRPRQDEHLELF